MISEIKETNNSFDQTLMLKVNSENCSLGIVLEKSKRTDKGKLKNLYLGHIAKNQNLFSLVFGLGGWKIKVCLGKYSM